MTKEAGFIKPLRLSKKKVHLFAPKGSDKLES